MKYYSIQPKTGSIYVIRENDDFSGDVVLYAPRGTAVQRTDRVGPRKHYSFNELRDILNPYKWQEGTSIQEITKEELFLLAL